VDLRTDRPIRGWACLGSPCASVYVPFFPPAVPGVLRDPAQWERFARLRERVETDPDGLTAVRGALTPIEHELWEAADSAFAAGTQESLGAFPDEATGLVTSGLDALGV